jgi:hypothetical protein
MDMWSWRVPLPVHVAPVSAPESTPADRNALAAAAGSDTSKLGDGAWLVIFATREGISPFYTADATSVQRKLLSILPDDAGARSGRSPAADGKSVTIVGSGSVGSKLAETLVRSGMRSVLLVDGDVFLPGNLERHVLDWRDVGSRKVHAMKRRLLQIAPGADIRIIDENLNWQRSARTHAGQFDAIAASDLIIDASGDPALSLTLGALASDNERAFVSVEVFEGGIGALVASCLPDRDPPYVLARAAFLQWCKEQAVVPPKSGAKRYEALSEANELLIADDAAVTMVAGHAARVILDVLDGKPAPSDAAWLLLGFRKEWVFDYGHGQSIGINVGKPVEPRAAIHDAEAEAFARALVKRIADAAQTSSSSS